MTNLSKKDRDNLIKILQEGKDVAAKEQAMKIFDLEEADTQKEYELKFKGKARQEDIIADTLAAPLQEVRAFNSDNGFEDDWNNRLIFGDNLMVLKHLYEDSKIKGKVKLIYIDPPFATKQDFMKDEEKAYKDKVVGSKFIEFTRKRLILLKELLSNDGSIYVHLDSKKGHYLKVILDEVFGENHFLNEVIWLYKTGGASKEKWAQKHDSLYFYSKSDQWIFNPQQEKSFMMHKYGFKKSDFKIDPETGLQYSMVYSRDVWDLPSVGSATSERVGYPTQKPEVLLERIIRASSNEGDIILDAFAGSGTTLAVAEKLNRRWIGIDCGKLAIYTMQKRMLNLRENIGDSGKLLKAKAFTLYNAGLYDWTEIKKLDFGHYRDFVLKLFQVREEKHIVRGIQIDGYIGNENAYLWDHTKKKNAKLDLEFLKSLHEAIGGKGGDVFYVIAPTNAFAFYEDEIKLENTTYKTLRVPQSVITELIKRGGDTIKQPTSEQDVNDTIDSVGFDFIQVPEVETEYKIGKPEVPTLLNQKTRECVIKLRNFKSKTLTKSPEEFENFETLSMVMVDFNYDGKVFDLDKVFYADQIKPDYDVRFDCAELQEHMMVIYLDIYGNEKKEILTLKDFKKK